MAAYPRQKLLISWYTQGAMTSVAAVSQQEEALLTSVTEQVLARGRGSLGDHEGAARMTTEEDTILDDEEEDVLHVGEAEEEDPTTHVSLEEHEVREITR